MVPGIREIKEDCDQALYFFTDKGKFFVKINDFYLEENLVFIIYLIFIKFNICQKLLIIITDNAENNNILCCILYVSFKHKFDNHLKEFFSCKDLM